MTESPRPFTIIESPFSAPTEPELVRNVYYAMLAVRDSLERGEAPYASHLFFTQMLDDNVLIERELGIGAGLDIARFAAQTAVYTDLGISRGMEYGIERAEKLGRVVTNRQLFADGLSESELESRIMKQVVEHDLPNEQAIREIYGRIITMNRKATA